MKRLFALLLLIMPLWLMAQDKPAPASNQGIGDVPYWVLDGQKILAAKFKTSGFDPNTVLQLVISKSPEVMAQYGITGQAGTAIFTTKKYAVHQYQEVFSSFSDDFESWLTSHGDDDAQFRYYVNGEEIPKTDDGVRKLFDLKKDNIESITMVQDEPAGSKYAAKIKITTKK